MKISCVLNVFEIMVILIPLHCRGIRRFDGLYIVIQR
nr:MAG TPA: hypothetical protein [Bacteriophage sp.]